MTMTLRRLILILLALLAAVPAAAQEKRIALTFDDVPRTRGALFTPEERTRRLIAQLRRAKVAQAAMFVNPGSLATADGAGGEQRIAAYVAAGHVIGDHSFSHPALSRIGATAFLADIDRSEAWLKGRTGYRPWFRFPFLDEGGSDRALRDAARAGLAARGLSNAYVTVDGSDWNIEYQLEQAVRAGKRVDYPALRTLYVETMVRSADFGDALARRVLGRSPAHVLLLHETDLAALYVADLARALRRDGWTIVTADAAYADPLAAAPAPDTPVAQGTRIEMIALEQGVPAPRSYERNDSRLANRLFATRVLHEKEAP
ncbi:MAG: polysaccharide deacetylase family protein [Sphingomonas adhaesiva]|uniref:polysaccharide deacetylase family protein n=1 Tax=Sphingomonas adhaesiva TaxID=28212 RepID=UPI002FFBDF68